MGLKWLVFLFYKYIELSQLLKCDDPVYYYSYQCDDYVLNDNVSGDLKVLRSALSAIATQSFTDVESRGRRLLRSYSHTAVVSP